MPPLYYPAYLEDLAYKYTECCTIYSNQKSGVVNPVAKFSQDHERAKAISNMANKSRLAKEPSGYTGVDSSIQFVGRCSPHERPSQIVAAPPATAVSQVATTPGFESSSSITTSTPSLQHPSTLPHDYFRFRTTPAMQRLMFLRQRLNSRSHWLTTKHISTHAESSDAKRNAIRQLLDEDEELTAMKKEIQRTEAGVLSIASTNAEERQEWKGQKTPKHHHHLTRHTTTTTTTISEKQDPTSKPSLHPLQTQYAAKPIPRPSPCPTCASANTPTDSSTPARSTPLRRAHVKPIYHPIPAYMNTNNPSPSSQSVNMTSPEDKPDTSLPASASAPPAPSSSSKGLGLQTPTSLKGIVERGDVSGQSEGVDAAAADDEWVDLGKVGAEDTDEADGPEKDGYSSVVFLESDDEAEFERLMKRGRKQAGSVIDG